MARVLLLSLVFPPDSVSTAQIVGDLAVDLRSRGHDVTVVTTTPHYNRDRSAELRQPRRNWWGPLVQRSMFNGIDVYHTLMPAKGPSVVGRLLAWCLFHVLSLAVASLAIGRVDIIVTPSPPLTMGVAAWLLGLRHRAPFIYHVLELYPDIAINLGAVRNRLAIRTLFALERFVYARAAAVGVITPGMRQNLLRKGVPSEHVRVIPNFVDTDVLKPIARATPNAFLEDYGLEERFVVSYAGNIGPAQGLERLLDAAALLKDEPRIVIVLIGAGTLWHTFEQRIKREGLPNVKLIPYQPFSRVPDIYRGSDLNAVFQASSTGSDAVPSKVYRVMASGRPLLAATVEGSDLAALVTAAGCGLVVPQADPVAIAAAIRHACENPADLDEMGAAGRRHVEAHYSRQRVTELHHELINDVITAAAASS